jgi:hypothetical protein
MSSDDSDDLFRRLAVIQLAVVGREPGMANFSDRALNGFFLTSRVRGLSGYRCWDSSVFECDAANTVVF